MRIPDFTGAEKVPQGLGGPSVYSKWYQRLSLDLQRLHLICIVFSEDLTHCSVTESLIKQFFWSMHSFSGLSLENISMHTRAVISQRGWHLCTCKCKQSLYSVLTNKTILITFKHGAFSFETCSACSLKSGRTCSCTEDRRDILHFFQSGIYRTSS
jgi:hypothetical protein